MVSAIQMGDVALQGGIGKTAGPLKGPHVLQIVACTDVGRPSKGGVAGSSAKRYEAVSLRRAEHVLLYLAVVCVQATMLAAPSRGENMQSSGQTAPTRG